MSQRPYNYLNEINTLNTKIPKPISDKIPQVHTNRFLSLIELLQINLNQVIIIHIDNNEHKGILEYAGDNYLILHDIKSKTKTLYPILAISAITFEDEIQYSN